MRKGQRLHREPDPRVRRSLVVAFATSALLVAGALTVVGVRVEKVHIAYRLDAVRTERGRAEERHRQLEIEGATLSTPSRLEARARQNGPGPGRRGPVRATQEDVGGGHGRAAAPTRRGSRRPAG